MLIVADIAGQFDALVRLTDQIPREERIVLLGDLGDRGHFSFQVVEWAMRNRGRVTTLLGNHEHMMIDYWRSEGNGEYYPFGCWAANGGSATILSYIREQGEKGAFPNAEHWEFLSNLPLSYYEPGKLLVTHAALHPKFEPEAIPLIESQADPDFDISVIWNRGEPVKRDCFQVFGHNSHWGLRYFEDWAICIDQSRDGVLTGFHWPTREILTAPYVTGKRITDAEV